MKDLYIARHGQDIDNANGNLNGRRDQPLTELGIEQAINLAKNIASSGLSFDGIFTSPLKRASKTAVILARELKMKEPIVIKNLIERDFGILTGEQIVNIPRMTKDILSANGVNYFLSVEGAETFPQLLERATMALKEIEHAECPLVVAHGDIGKMMYASYYNLPWEQVLAQFHFGNSDLLYLAPHQDPTVAHKFQFKQHNL